MHNNASTTIQKYPDQINESGYFFYCNKSLTTLTLIVVKIASKRAQKFGLSLV